MIAHFQVLLFVGASSFLEGADDILDGAIIVSKLFFDFSLGHFEDRVRVNYLDSVTVGDATILYARCRSLSWIRLTIVNWIMLIDVMLFILLINLLLICHFPNKL